MSAGPPVRARTGAVGTGRVEAFSDGVMAVAITLLVLDLHASAEEGSGSLGSQLAHEWPSFAAYALSFLVIGVIWVNHHALFTLIAGVDRPMLFINLVLLMWVSTIPFTTATLAAFLRSGGADGRYAALIYGIAMEGMAISFTLILRRAIICGLTVRPVSRELGRTALRRFGLGTLIYPVVTLLGLLSPAVFLCLMAALTVWYALEQTPILPEDPVPSVSR